MRGDGDWTTAAEVQVRRRGRILGKFAKYSHWDFLMAYTGDTGWGRGSGRERGNF